MYSCKEVVEQTYNAKFDEKAFISSYEFNRLNNTGARIYHMTTLNSSLLRTHAKMLTHIRYIDAAVIA